MKRNLIIIFIVFAQTYTLIPIVYSTAVNSCDGDILLPEVDIKDCDQPPCVFYTGSKANLTMKFRAPYFLDKIAPKVYASVGDLTIPYPLSQTDACEGIYNTPCPLVENEWIEYNFGLDVLASFPEIAIRLEFMLKDTREDTAIVCFTVDAQVKKPES